MTRIPPATRRPVILAFTRHYLPGYRAGGPIRSIANMIDRLGDEMTFRVITTDRDVADSVPYEMVEVDQWNRLGKAQVLYTSPAARSLLRIAQLLRKTPHDAVYLNSILDPMFTLRVLLLRRLGAAPAKPVVIAPRGEFSPGAWRLKRWKKAPYLWLLKRLGGVRGVIWQASSDLEQDDIVRAIGARRAEEQGSVLIASNLAPCSSVESGNKAPRSRSVGDPLDVCFLSRISPKKNLDYALRILQRVRVPVRFTIYGPIEDRSYWKECEGIMGALPSHVTTIHRGNIEPDRVVSILAEHDLFFLPTRGENFGHVIHEAMRAGLPVLISDQTPWRDLERLEVGWALPLSDAGAFAEVIEEVSSWGLERLAEWRRNAREHAAAVAEDEEVLEANRNLFSRDAPKEVSAAA